MAELTSVGRAAITSPTPPLRSVIVIFVSRKGLKNVDAVQSFYLVL
jgi:hypothetical protein